jgi:acyl carrier protein
MTNEASSTARTIIRDAICRVAPDVDPAYLDGLADDVPLKQELELDSMDQLNIAADIFERCGADIPERDYGHMETLGSFEAYLRDLLDGG